VKKAVIGGVVLVIGGLVAFFVLEGRFMLEGGRAPWAVINDDMDVLREALKTGVSAEEKQDALGRAVGRGNIEALGLLVEAGADVNHTKDNCYLENTFRFSRAAMGKALLDHGADPSVCKNPRAKMMDEAIRYGNADIPEQDLVFIMSKLYADGEDVSAALASAQKYKLDDVIAYLKAPGGEVAASKNNPSLLPKGKPGSVSRDDLKTVCDGKALPDAAEYKKQEGAAAQIYYFERRFKQWRWPGRGPGQPRLPRWWFSFKEPANTQLVACVDALDKKKVKECRYEGAGGGISVYDTTWKITLRETKTGKLVGEESFPMKASQKCDFLKWGKTQEGQFPNYGDKLQSFLTPHVGGPT